MGTMIKLSHSLEALPNFALQCITEGVTWREVLLATSVSRSWKTCMADYWSQLQFLDLCGGDTTDAVVKLVIHRCAQIRSLNLSLTMISGTAIQEVANHC